jgi:glycosyltransferase involved in cell wall biosynthesis
MRILMVSQFFPPVSGGEERMVEQMSVELVRRGHEVLVLTLETPDAPSTEMYRGVAVRRISGIPQRLPGLYEDPTRRHAAPIPDPLISRTMRQAVRSYAPDVIHGHNWLAASAFPISRTTSVPLVLSLHDFSLVCATRRFVHRGRPCTGPGLGKCLRCATSHYRGPVGPPVAIATLTLRRSALGAVDTFLPVSNAVAKGTGLADVGARFQVLPNFLSEEPIDEEDEILRELPSGEFMLFVGDLAVDKGVDVLLDAHRSLPHAWPLVLIGRPLSPRVLTPHENVRVLGQRPLGEVRTAMRRAGVVVVPSITPEAFGLVALEAMTAGKPVVATRNGGLSDLVLDGQTGLLVRPGDVRELSAALTSLQGTAGRRAAMGAAGRRRAARFTARAVIPRLEAVYRSATDDDPERVSVQRRSNARAVDSTERVSR